MPKTERILSIDIMRGLTLFLMLFVNDLYVPGVPKWLVHTAANQDGMGLADWVFPGFLFMVGLAIPFAFKARLSKGHSNRQLFIHTITRTASLLVIGVFMVNIGSYNSELTGINKFLWAILVYISIFLVWNYYPTKIKIKILPMLLKGLGIIGLIILAFIYRSGSAEHISWMKTSWWGILGLIGWGYLVSALVYLLVKDKLVPIALFWLGFVGLNMLAQTSYVDILNPLKPILGVIINGNVPSIVLSGLFVGVILLKYGSNHKKFIMFLIPLGLACIGLGFVLRKWYIISKIIGTPSWAMLCNGISMLVFALLFFILDHRKWQKWSSPFLPAGKNSLTTYLAPDFLYYTIWGMGLNILFYKQDQSAWLAVGGSLVWAFAMIGFAALLSKVHIRLKL